MEALILHNIRSAHNVGSLFRTADAVGVKHIYLSGITPAPKDRFGRDDQKISKVALGAEKTVSWERKEVAEVIELLKEKKIPLIALEQTPEAHSVFSYAAPERFALVVGEERGGVSEEILKEVNDTVYIPMYGTKDSLNVSVATGIALYALREVSR